MRVRRKGTSISPVNLIVALPASCRTMEAAHVQHSASCIICDAVASMASELSKCMWSRLESVIQTFAGFARGAAPSSGSSINFSTISSKRGFPSLPTHRIFWPEGDVMAPMADILNERVKLNLVTRRGRIAN